MIRVRAVKPSEIDDAKNFIRRIFPNAMVQITEDDLLLLAEEMGQFVGFAHIIDEGERVLIQGIGVTESMRGQGVGTILLEHILHALRDNDRPIFLKVKALNPVIDLYCRYGFFLHRFGDSHMLVKKVDN